MPKYLDPITLIHDDGLLSLAGLTLRPLWVLSPGDYRQAGDHRQLSTINGTLPNTGDHGATGDQSIKPPGNTISWPLELGDQGVATMEECLIYLAQKWSKIEFDPKSIRVRAKNCPLKTRELKQLAAAAFGEMFRGKGGD